MALNEFLFYKLKFMHFKEVRDQIFIFHRYLGLGVGFIIALIGITGSLLIFQPDLEQYWVTRTFEPIIPRAQRVSIETAVNTVQTAYKSTGLKPTTIKVAPENYFYFVRLSGDEGDDRLDVFVNAYTGEILGDRNYEHTFTANLLKLHVSLFAGDGGTMITGIAGFLLFILSLTGVILWPGWRKLMTGFKIKLKAHPKRMNFDIHKVAGITAAIFLCLTSFTGFCWNFYDWTTPLIYAATFTKEPADLTSTPLPGQTPLGLDELLQRSDAALPGMITTYIYPPIEPEAVFTVGKRFSNTLKGDGYSSVELDQYSGDVLRVWDERKLPLGDYILNTFEPLHYGTFGGLPTRILYVFVGFAPIVLIITGFIMWQHRYKGISKAKPSPFGK
jgi:uncharacterized iron-regulated membrane protein